MSKVQVMVNGLPGKMASCIVEHILQDRRFILVPYSFTGPETTAEEHQIGRTRIALVKPEKKEGLINHIEDVSWSSFISLDFTHPSAVNANADFYCYHGLPFVMGTTGGDRKALLTSVSESSSSAVIALNMAKPIVAFQEMLQYAADEFPNLFFGYDLNIWESHQQGKADTSGTAKALVSHFHRLGIDFPQERIRMERDPKHQLDLGIPEEHLGGHGWHTYTITSPDKTVALQFVHNVNGRDVYAIGALDAAIFLQQKVDSGSRGTVFTMIDVLRG